MNKVKYYVLVCCNVRYNKDSLVSHSKGLTEENNICRYYFKTKKQAMSFYKEYNIANEDAQFFTKRMSKHLFCLSKTGKLILCASSGVKNNKD